MAEFHLDKTFHSEDGFNFDWTYPHIDLEIGCGVGWHPIHYCAQNPNRKLIAIEHTQAKFQKFQNRLQKHDGLNNCTAIHANAISWVNENIPSESLEQVFILYPNPNPKSSQKNKRWHHMPFMEKLIACLKEKGHLEMRTNIYEYYSECKNELTDKWGLDLVFDKKVQINQTRDFEPTTHFEKKYFVRGETLYFLRFQKN